MHALVDPETGSTRDVIVKKIEQGNVWHDRQLGLRKWSRYIPGLNIKIPWPIVPPKPEETEHDADTPRLRVEARTWVPSLLRPPMPPSVIDELRNKYSLFRDRHDEDYIEEKLQVEEEKSARLSMASMTSPTMELRKRDKKERVGMGRRATLTDEQLARIGEVMAKSRGLDLSSLPAESLEPEKLDA